ncbi:peptidase M24, structural domain-containing protein [Lipomyces japonicus]|uniref:peptidase M24, structural domain-containing protein n=1 Tax=Lipomyces japonicus TaxID=56871 RepID=UPI0034CE89A8
MPTIERYPSKSHARRVAKHFSGLLPDAFTDDKPRQILLLAAARLKYWPFSDQAQPFRQNRNFYYLTGCDLPDAYVLYDVELDRLVLFLPPVDKEDVMWSGEPITITEAKEEYDVDEVLYADVIKSELQAIPNRIVYTAESLVGDDHRAYLKDIELLVQLQSSDQYLLEALEESRLIKDDFELRLMRKASEISDNAHLKVLSTMSLQTNERHIHAEFVYHSMRAGSKNQSYDPICCTGRHCSTLHYVRNNEEIAGKQLLLIDAGAEWNNYASDVTRTFPISGEWTPEARAIYELVLEMQTACESLVKPGAVWDDLHLLAHKILIRGFLKLGIFKGGSEDEILESRVSAAFLPHGLGHTLGMDTHDTGGRANYADSDLLFRYLRIRRKLESGMVVTVEPGIYFSPFLIDPYLNGHDGFKGGHYIDRDVLEKFWEVGGVRIEDDVLVTDNGSENFTKVPKDPDVLSKIIKAGLKKTLVTV